jgi:hypothetical protein
MKKKAFSLLPAEILLTAIENIQKRISIICGKSWKGK